MGFFFTTFYQPIANVLFWVMDVLNNYNLAFGILLLVIIVKLVVLPLSVKNTKFQIRMKAITDDLKKIRDTIKDKKEQAEKTLALYKKAGINPFTPFLLLIIQIPIFIGVFFVVRDLGQGEFSYTDTLYSSIVHQPIDLQFLFLSLADKGGLFIALLVGITQYVLMHFSQKHLGTTVSKAQKIVFTVIFPIVAGLISFFFVAAVGVYWLFINLVSILQECVVLHTIRQKENGTQGDMPVSPPDNA